MHYARSAQRNTHYAKPLATQGSIALGYYPITVCIESFPSLQVVQNTRVKKRRSSTSHWLAWSWTTLANRGNAYDMRCGDGPDEIACGGEFRTIIQIPGYVQPYAPVPDLGTIRKLQGLVVREPGNYRLVNHCDPIGIDVRSHEKNGVTEEGIVTRTFNERAKLRIDKCYRKRCCNLLHALFVLGRHHHNTFFRYSLFFC